MSNLPVTFTDLMVALNACFFNDPDDVIGEIELEETEEEGEYLLEEEEYDLW